MFDTTVQHIPTVLHICALISYTFQLVVIFGAVYIYFKYMRRGSAIFKNIDLVSNILNFKNLINPAQVCAAPTTAVDELDDVLSSFIRPHISENEIKDVNGVVSRVLDLYGDRVRDINFTPLLKVEPCSKLDDKGLIKSSDIENDVAPPELDNIDTVDTNDSTTVYADNLTGLNMSPEDLKDRFNRAKLRTCRKKRGAGKLTNILSNIDGLKDVLERGVGGDVNIESLSEKFAADFTKFLKDSKIA